MSFGFPAFYETQQEFTGERDAARAAVIYAFELLGWDFTPEDPNHFRATVPVNMASWGETLTVGLAAGQVTVRSACTMPFQLIDWGKNRQNVEQFLAHFSPKDQRVNKLSSTASYIDEAGNTPLDRVLADQDEA